MRNDVKVHIEELDFFKTGHSLPKQKSLGYGLATGGKMVALNWDDACENSLMEILDVDCQWTAVTFTTGALQYKPNMRDAFDLPVQTHG